MRLRPCQAAILTCRSGASRSDEPGTHKHRKKARSDTSTIPGKARVHGFRVRPCRPPRNDAGRFASDSEERAQPASPSRPLRPLRGLCAKVLSFYHRPGKPVQGTDMATKDELKQAVCEAIDRAGNSIIAIGEEILH